MALETIQFKRGTTAARPSLLDGEFYINRTTGRLEFKSGTGIIECVAMNQLNGLVATQVQAMLDADYLIIGENGLIQIKQNDGGPVASNVIITGTQKVGETLSVNYNYSDDESDVEGATQFQWFRNSTTTPGNRVAISGATGATYQLQIADFNFYISASVRPVAATGTLFGATVFASPTGQIIGTDTAAPTGVVIDDATGVNTLDWTNTPGFNSLSDYQYTINGGATYSEVTQKPIQVGNVNKAPGTVGVRVKGATGRNPSPTVYNQDPFNVDVLSIGTGNRLFFEGDSNTTGGAFHEIPGYFTGDQTRWANLVAGMAAREGFTMAYSNPAAGGLTAEAIATGDMATRYADINGETVFMMLIGLNDLGNLKTAQATYDRITEIKQYLQFIRGCNKIIIGTYFATGSQPIEMDALNNLIRNGATDYFVADFAAIPELSVWKQHIFYADTYHVGMLGMELMALEIRSLISEFDKPLPTIGDWAIEAPSKNTGDVVSITFVDLGGTDSAVFKWFRADDETGLNSVRIAVGGTLATGQTYTIQADDEGKYIYAAISPRSSSESYNTIGIPVFTDSIVAEGASPLTMENIYLMNGGHGVAGFTDAARGGYWNATWGNNGYPEKVSALNSAGAAATAIEVYQKTPYGSVGGPTGNTSTIYPQAVIDSAYGGAFAKIGIVGLNPAKVYDIHVFSSGHGMLPVNCFNGDTNAELRPQQTLDTDLNGDREAIFTGIPGQAVDIQISWIHGMRIKEYA